MVTLIVVLYINLIMMDSILFVEIRKLVYSFLLSKRNVKSARNIHASQSKFNRITLLYIKNYTIYLKEFNFFQQVRIFNIIFIVPQYILLLILNLLSLKKVMIALIILSIIKIIFNVVISFQFSPKRISKFDKRYRR